MKRLYFFLSVICLLSACNTSQTARSGSFHSVNPLRITIPAPKELLTINSIGLLAPQYPEGGGCNLSDLESMLLRALRSELYVDVVPSDKLKETAVDGRLSITVQTCAERKGSSLGVSQPAAVGFETSLIRVSDGKEIWRAEFVREEKEFSSDILRGREVLQSRAGWRSAREILQSGIYDAARDLATRRDEQFYLGSLVSQTDN